MNTIPDPADAGLTPEEVPVLDATQSTSDEECRAVEEITDRLVIRFPEVSPDYVRDDVIATWAEFHGRPIRAFVPVLVERTVREHLASLAAE